MNRIKLFVVCLMASFCAALSVSAKVKQQPVYMFGFSASFTDSVVYITDVQYMDSAYIDTKTDFLQERPRYSDQLMQYVEATFKLPNSTCAVFFNTSKKKLLKEFLRLKKHYANDRTVVVKTIPLQEFHFVPEKHYFEND